MLDQEALDAAADVMAEALLSDMGLVPAEIAANVVQAYLSHTRTASPAPTGSFFEGMRKAANMCVEMSEECASSEAPDRYFHAALQQAAYEIRRAMIAAATTEST